MWVNISYKKLYIFCSKKQQEKGFITKPLWSKCCTSLSHKNTVKVTKGEAFYWPWIFFSVLHQSSRTHRTPVPSRQRRFSPANQSSGPPSVLRTASFRAFLPTMPLLGTDLQPQETAPMRSMFKVTSQQLNHAFTCTEPGGGYYRILELGLFAWLIALRVKV